MGNKLVASLLLPSLSFSFMEQTSQLIETDCCCPCSRVLWQTPRARLARTVPCQLSPPAWGGACVCIFHKGKTSGVGEAGGPHA